MKLQNKKTGYVDNWCIDKDVIRTCDGSIVYNSIAELIADWEDYEEPIEYWYIDIDGIVEVNSWDTEDDIVKGMRTIGNYFETKEEAEKAVEKLKAWKRLKDKGFKLDGVVDNFFCLDIYMKGSAYEEIKEDLKIVFGGEE